MKLKLVVLVVLVAVGIGALAVTFGGLGANAAASTQDLTSPATVGDVTDDVAATGTLAAAESYGLLFGGDPYLIGDDESAPTAEGTWPVTEVTVKVGDTVAEGDTLATADTADLETDLERATADVRAANINVQIAKDALEDAQDADDTDAERQAQLTLYGAQNQHSQAFEARRTIQQQIKAAAVRPLLPRRGRAGWRHGARARDRGLDRGTPRRPGRSREPPRARRALHGPAAPRQSGHGDHRLDSRP